MGHRAKHIDISQLVRQAQDGNHAAFEELYRATAQVQYFFIVGKVGREAASDILQELYLIAWNNISSIEPSAFVGYLNATASNLCKRYFKGQGTSKAPLPAENEFLEAAGTNVAMAIDGAQDPALGVSSADEHSRLLRALRDDLDDRERTAILLRYYQDMKLEDVASALGVSLATVKRLLNRALATLRRKLGFLPMGAAFSRLLDTVVESDLAPSATLSLKRLRPAQHGAHRGRAVRAVGVLAVALTVVSVAFAVQTKLAIAGTSEGEAPRFDAEGPVLVESRTMEGDTLLLISDDTGVEHVWCVNADGARYDASLEELGAVDIGKGEPAANLAPGGKTHWGGSAETVWRVSLPSGFYELWSVDTWGNESQGSLRVVVTPDVF